MVGRLFLGIFVLLEKKWEFFLNEGKLETCQERGAKHVANPSKNPQKKWGN
jgi:hypothetical protein